MPLTDLPFLYQGLDMTSSRTDSETNLSDESLQSTNKIFSWLQKQKDKINSPGEILIPTAIEATIMTSCAGVTYYFLDKENLHAYNNPFTLSTVFTFINILLRSPKLTEEQRRKALLFACSLIFSMNDFFNRIAITHESGHAFACFALFKNATPVIKTFSNFKFNAQGGYTDCNSLDVSDFQLALGKTKSNVLFSSAGTNVNMLLASIMLIVAEFLPEGYFETKCHLRVPAAVSIIHAVYHALTALWLCDSMPGHDFCNIQDKTGITPAQSAMIICSIGLMLQLTLSGTSYLRKRCKTNPSQYYELTNEHELATVEELNEAEETTIDMPKYEPNISPKIS